MSQIPIVESCISAGKGRRFFAFVDLGVDISYVSLWNSKPSLWVFSRALLKNYVSLSHLVCTGGVLEFSGCGLEMTALGDKRLFGERGERLRRKALLRENLADTADKDSFGHRNTTLPGIRGAGLNLTRVLFD